MYLEFYGKEKIDQHTRRVVYISLSIICGIGILSFLFLKDIRERYEICYTRALSMTLLSNEGQTKF